ncbi:MAG TPA: TonB-dependent receptor [Steroidobacteraceae bacterium]|jgi:iron complex outermembrane receptor protein|nr:TonB-dependent receptor [Steroidobacteraceae bacterium]
MEMNRKLQWAVRAALAAAAATAAAPAAWSQIAPAAANDASGLEEVVVTGSRITSANLTAISPITSVDAGYISSSNLTRVEDILNNLPMVFAGQNSTVSNGSDGSASVNLRGLGPTRTLVLVNNRRLGPGSGGAGSFGTSVSDINEIPAALIERVDILTGGASSVYGADAVAGVVNFVLNTHFEGARIDTSYSFFQHNNNNSVAQGAVAAAGDALPNSSVNTGFGKNVSVLLGSNFADNKGNATFYFTYDKAAAVLQSKYDYSACTLDATAAGGVACGGSGTSAKDGAGGYFIAFDKSGSKAQFTNTVDGKTGAFRPFVSSDLYNFGPLNFYQRPNERYTGGSFLNYQINEHVNVYGELMFARNNTNAQIAASGDFQTQTPIPCNDPLLTAAEKAAICAAAAAQGNTGPDATALLYIGRRNVEGGGRVLDVTNNAFRAVTGVKGDIIDGLTFDVYVQRDSVDSMQRNLNYFGSDRVANALNVITDPATGLPACAAAVSGAAPNCVPWNIWVPNGVTAAATNYLSIPLLLDATTVEYVASGSVTADLGKWNIQSPMAVEGIKVNAGAEYRSESSVASPDLASEQGNAEGAGGAVLPVSGNYHVKEVFTEFGIPLLDHKPMAESLGLEIGYRYSDYSLGFKTNTYKFGGEWAPTRDFRVRASYSRAVRAPNISELYTPQTVALDGSTDPCSGAVGANGLVASGATPAQCALTGVSAAQYGHINAAPAGQYNGLAGGNPHLLPEKSDTYTAGIVLTPRFIDNLAVSFDYYNIKLQDSIGAIGADTIIDNCIASGNPIYCSAINRDPTGSLFRNNSGFISDTNVNFGDLTTRGVDAKVNYRLALPDLGSLLFNLEGTRLINLGREPLTGGPSFDCAGYFGTTCGAPNSKWRHVFNTTWATPWSGFDLTARWRFLSGADSEQISPDPQLTGPNLPLTQHIKPYSYLDLSADVSLYKVFRLQLGVNNVLDKDPPIVISPGGNFASDCPTITPNGSSCNGNTFPGTYDSLGRFFFARITAQF